MMSQTTPTARRSLFSFFCRRGNQYVLVSLLSFFVHRAGAGSVPNGDTLVWSCMRHAEDAALVKCFVRNETSDPKTLKVTSLEFSGQSLALLNPESIQLWAEETDLSGIENIRLTAESVASGHTYGRDHLLSVRVAHVPAHQEVVRYFAVRDMDAQGIGNAANFIRICFELPTQSCVRVAMR